MRQATLVITTRNTAEKNRDKKRTVGRVNEIMLDLGITKDEVLVNCEVRMTLTRRLKFKEGIPGRQIAEIFGLNRSTV